MPYIEVKLAKQASRKQERILTEKLGGNHNSTGKDGSRPYGVYFF